MKTKLLLQTSAAILLLFANLAAPAQTSPQIDPRTGLPVSTGGPTIDPATGLPVAAPAAPATPAEPQWIDHGWTDPNIILTNVSYDGLPLSEVARDLRERFGEAFDILPMPHTFDQDWGSQILIHLQLKNVTASEIFNAMNLVFENDRTPVRWELKENTGDRGLAMLRVLPEAAPAPPPQQVSQPEIRRVFFVGDLFGNQKSDGKNAQEQMLTVLDAIAHVWTMTGASPDNLNKHLQIYAPGQLLIISGTPEQLNLAQQTLQALKKKSELEHAEQNLIDLNQQRVQELKQKVQSGDTSRNTARPAPKTDGSKSDDGDSK